MKPQIFGVTCLACFVFTIAANLAVGPQLAAESSTVRSDSDQVALRDRADSLIAVGWEGCPWCKRFKEETIPTLAAEGYEVGYVDISEWKGPVVKYGPTLFFFKKKVIIRVHKGFLTAEEVKKWMQSPKD